MDELKPVELKISEKVSIDKGPIDEILGGGLERGIITNFYGASGTGKTNISIVASSSTIKEGKKVIYVDTESGFTPERFLQIHENEEDLNKIFLFAPKSFEEQKKVIYNIDKTSFFKDVGLVVVDSVVALYRLNLSPEKVQESNTDLSKQLFYLSNVAKTHRIPIIVTNQIYVDFETSEIELVGKDIPKYYSKCMVFLEKKDASVRRAVLKKHRYMAEGKSVDFVITSKGIEFKKRMKLF